ncbi:unnamed protein product [Phaedon cochleariae]|uniref:BZIP domain-containing protein n=1 Tax=Phaedon cochleariae TaxID=80249 RepID=A0A9P0GPP4_PHACE|nr:unnamed protein product [Phaedon cochleariae]
MITTDDFGLEEYIFKNSPESCSDNSYSTDYMDVTSDEDFLSQLSADLDIPLLLNTEEDELGMLNSFFDKSPEEILSEIASPPYSPDTPDKELPNTMSENSKMHFSNSKVKEFPNILSEVKWESSTNSGSPDYRNSPSPLNLQQPNSPLININQEILINSPPVSPVSLKVNITKEIKKNILHEPVKLSSNASQIQKHKTIIPRSRSSTLPLKKPNVVVLNSDLKPVVTSQNSNIIVLDNIKFTSVHNSIVSNKPLTTMSKITQAVIPPVIINTGNRLSIANANIDPKVFKLYQRKIKNRESASLSRKRKKDYVTSLEEQVKQLAEENRKLQMENIKLKERLAQYEDKTPSKKDSKTKPSLYLCVFLLVLGVNLNLIRNPFSTKHDLELIQKDMPKLGNHPGRNLLWAPEDNDPIRNKTSTFSPFFMCPATINQTESARLVLELERWIGKPADSPIKSNPDRNVSKQVKPKRLRSTFQKRSRNRNERLVDNNPKNEIQVFQMRPEQIYSEFFEAIHRRDDTFYVVSFTDQHMLLPALYHNKTRRPKMSLIMPSMLSNDTASKTSMIPLMQIDCEVLDTKLIQVRQASVPQNMKVYSNATKEDPASFKVNESTGKRTRYNEKPYKPYFMNRNSFDIKGKLFDLN